MAEILKWSFLGLGALFVLVPICYYWFSKTPIVNKQISDSATASAKKANAILQKQFYSNSIPVLFIFVILLYLLSWKFALIFLVGALFAVTVRIFASYFAKKIYPVQLLEAEKEVPSRTADIYKVMTGIFVFGFAFLAIFALKLLFNDINILYALVLGAGLETFLVQIGSKKLVDQNYIIANYFFVFSFALVVLATVAESFYPNFTNLTLLFWAVPLAGLKIFLLSILISFLLKKIKRLKSIKLILPISIAVLSAVSFYLIPHYLFRNDQSFSPLRMFASLLLGLVVVIVYYFIPKKSEGEHNILGFIPILILVLSMLLANYLAGYLGMALVITAESSLFWVMFSKEDRKGEINQNIVTNIFGLSAILMFLFIQKYFQSFAFKSYSDINMIASLLLGGLISYFVVHYARLDSKKPYANLFALISILIPLAIVALLGSSYLIGLLTGILIVGLILSCTYQNSKILIYPMLSVIFLLTILLKDFLQTDLSLTFKIIIAGVLLISISAFALFKPNTDE